MLTVQDLDQIERLISTRTDVYATFLAAIRGGLGNWSVITVGATTNGQGAAAGGIVALNRLVSKSSGNFLWFASAVSAATAPADGAGTFAVQSQTGTGTVTTAGSGAAPGFAGSAASFNGLVSTGVAGTPITISAGGGGSLTQYTRAVTVGTAAVGDSFSAAGIMENSVAGGNTRFPLGNNVILNLLWSNGGAVNRTITSIVLGLLELPF